MQTKINAARSAPSGEQSLSDFKDSNFDVVLLAQRTRNKLPDLAIVVELSIVMLHYLRTPVALLQRRIYSGLETKTAFAGEYGRYRQGLPGSTSEIRQKRQLVLIGQERESLSANLEQNNWDCCINPFNVSLRKPVLQGFPSGSPFFVFPTGQVVP